MFFTLALLIPKQTYKFIFEEATEALRGKENETTLPTIRKQINK